MLTESAYIGRLKVVAVVMLLAAPLVLWAAFLSIQGMHTSPVQWVPESDEERRTYEWFKEQFEGEDAIVVSWNGCTIDDTRLDELCEQLSSDDEQTKAKDESKWFARIITGYHFLQQQTASARRKTVRDFVEARDNAVERIRGVLVGPNRESTVAIVVLSDAGARDRRLAINRIHSVAVEVCGSRDEVLLAGPAADSAAIDQESVFAVYAFSLPSVAISFVLCLICLSSLRYTLAIILSAAYGEGLVLAMVYVLGLQMNAVLIVLPTLVFVLTVSAGIHLTNYYLDESRLRGKHGSVTRALQRGWLPCLLAVATTVLGLGSLGTSEIMPIRQFSVVSCLGLVLSVSLLFLILPGVLSRWHVQRPEETQEVAIPNGKGTGQHEKQLGLHLLSSLIIVAFLALMVAGSLGLAKLEANADVRSLLGANNRVSRDTRRLEQTIGPLTPVEVILRCDANQEMLFINRMHLVNQLERSLAMVGSDPSVPATFRRRIQGTLSAATFAPEIPRETIARALVNGRFEKRKDKLIASRFLAIDPTTNVESWRISARIELIENLDYGQYVALMRRELEGTLDRIVPRERDKFEIVVTGSVPLADRAHRAMLRDLYRSLFTATILVGLAMVLILRGVIAGLLAMLPNLFPIFAVFGCMGWIGLQVDIGTIMTAGVALGIAVDDTLHFVTWFRRESVEGASPAEAVRMSLRHCGRAMLQTTLVCGLGLFVLMFSDFLPTQRFALMMCVLLMSALVGDLILLPALLAGPLGRFFRPRRSGVDAPGRSR